jgi:5-(aminomethyl)-3-furanmethanol phosphate kinase
MPFYVLKLGGSLIGSAKAIVSRLSDLESKGYSFLVVPGGGPLADLVRGLFSKYSLSEEAAHWMAVLAMEQYAYLLADGTGAALTTEIANCVGVKVLLPYHVLRENDSGLEHCWDYTSDAVATLVAVRLNADLIKATNVDGIILNGKLVEEVTTASLVRVASCLDHGSLELLKGRRCWILNGTDPDKLIDSILSGRGGTVVKG